MTDREISADVAVIGAGLGGIAAALAAARTGQRVILTEEAPWIGGQMTSQAVGHCDDHPWIEQFGATATYRQLRENIRDYYRRWFPLTAEARSQRFLSPGAGTASALHFEPRAALMSLWGMLQPHLSAGTIRLLEQHAPSDAASANDTVQAVAVRDRRTGERLWIHARYFIDATEQGQLLPLSGTEYVTGAEAQSETGEPHAPAVANPLDLQAITWCFVMDQVPGVVFSVPNPGLY